MQEEVAKFKNFKTKAKIKEPQFHSAHILLHNMAPDFEETVGYTMTDEGICTTINGNNMDETFAKNSRIESLGKMLDHRTKLTKDAKKKIPGSGSLYKTEFWLNARKSVGDKDVGSITMAAMGFMAIRAEIDL